MRSDPDGSNESDSASEPDEFDSLVLDDNFVASGIPEASLAPHERALPPAMRLRPPKKAVPDDDPPRRPWAQPDFGNSGRLRSVGLLLILATLLMSTVVLSGLLRIAPLGSAATGAPLPVATEFASASDRFPPRLQGLARSTPIGTCFDVAITDSSQTAGVISCGQSHQFELVGFEVLGGRVDQYPAASYWVATVDPACGADLARYLGLTADQWPATVVAASFTPSPTSWARGDRLVYCVASSTPAASGTVREQVGVTLTHSA